MPGLMAGVGGRHQHRGDGGLRFAVPVGAAVEQLGGPDPLGDQAEEAEFDVAGAQDGAGFGVLEPCRGLVERVLDRKSVV